MPVNPPEPGTSHQGNRLLQALPPELQETLQSSTALVRLPTGSVLGAGTGESRPVYFPLEALVALIHTDDQGASTQIGIVGPDGMVGLTEWLTRQRWAKALVLVGGAALRCDGDLLQQHFDTSPSLRRALMGYSAELTMQAAQRALCGTHHSPGSQLCSLLMTMLDRGAGEDLAMTHELAAQLIGVRRETVTQAAMRLQQRGYIQGTRGHIRILDREGLARASCGCHRSAALRPHEVLAG